MRQVRLIESGQPTRWLLLLIVLASMALAAYPLFFSPPSAYSVGGGCNEPTPDAVVDFVEGEAEYTVPEPGLFVEAICIGYGEGHSESEFYSDAEVEGYDSCLDSEGIGGPSVTVSLTDIELCFAEHIDIYLGDEEATATPTPTPTLTPTPTPELCSDASATLAVGGAGQATYLAPPGFRVTAVCASFTADDFEGESEGGEDHTGPLTNGLHAGGCLLVGGVGTGIVSAFLLPQEGCPDGIDHLDVYQAPIPPTPTPTATVPIPTQPPATATPTPTATATPTATVSAPPTPTATPTPTPTPTPAPTPTPTAAATSTATPPVSPASGTPPADPPTGDTPTGDTPTGGGGAPGGSLPPGGTGGSAGAPGGGIVGVPGQAGTATPTSTVTATATPTRTPTPTPTPTRTVTPTPTATPAPTSSPTVEATGSSFRPAFAMSARDAGDTSGNAEVVFTNLLLAALLVLLILFDASIINSTVEENHEFFEPWLDRVTGPARGLFEQLGFAVQQVAGNWSLERLTRYSLLLGLTSLVYAMLDPDFGLNQSTAVLMLSLIIGIGLITVTFDGAQVWLARRRFGLAAGIMFFPFAVILAIGSVLISRLFDVHPGIIYGFVAAAALLPGQEASRSEDGQLVYIPMLVVFAFSLVSWLLVSPFRAWAEDGSFFGALFESVAVAMFVGGVQGLLFTLVPIEFMDGQKVWKWSRLAWFSITLPVAFVFLHVLMNPQGDFGSPIEETSLRALFILCIAIWLATAAVWLYFRQRRARMQSV
ncbi:MAG: FGLLP motif-containing membrane protein [Dehalococcoidia bacterium]